MLKFLIMFFGMFAMFFTGYPHIWSVYSPYVMDEFGWSFTKSSMCFYLELLFFVIGNILGGKLRKYWKSQYILLVGGIIQAGGVLLSAKASTLFMMITTYSFLQGIGQGMIYTTILTTILLWYPNQKGLASGLVVTANGICGLVLAPISRRLLETVGLKCAFLLIGTFMLLSGFLAFLFVREPASIKKTVYEEKGYTSLEMLQTKQFYYLIFVMTGGLTSYFIISPISQSLQIERGVLPSIAIRAVMIGSLANAFSRIIFPWLSDKTSRIRCIQWILILAILAMFSLLFFDHLTTIAIILLYGCYGGIMGSFPAFTTSIFGLLHAGENYGYVMSGMIFASILALIISNITTTVEDAIIIGIILEVIALFFLVSLSKVVYNDKQ